MAEAKVELVQPPITATRRTTEQQIADFLKAHPGSTVKEVEEGTLIRSNVSKILRQIGMKTGKRGKAELWEVDPVKLKASKNDAGDNADDFSDGRVQD